MPMGGNELVADIEEGLAPELVSGSFALFNDHVDLPDPADGKRHYHCAKRHHNTLRQHVVEVKPVTVPRLCGVQVIGLGCVECDSRGVYLG